MKALLFHSKNFTSRNSEEEQHFVEGKSVITFLTFEKDDTKEKLGDLISEIKKAHIDFGTSRLVIFPFAHLSNELLECEKASTLFNLLEEALKKENLAYSILPFGTDKEFFLHVFGHPGNVRFRSF